MKKQIIQACDTKRQTSEDEKGGHRGDGKCKVAIKEWIR